MKILLSNDDGIHSQGLILLASTLEKAGHQMTVVAPERERSTTGHMLTLHKPLRVYNVRENQYAVSGSPADCVYMATRKLMADGKPDLVISGINRGANLGNDHFYSGTVAAAREAVLYGIASIAISLCFSKDKSHNPPHWETAADFLAKFLPEFRKFGFPPHRVLNINVPNLPKDQIKGVRLSHQGKRIYSDEMQENIDPRGKKYYWIGGSYVGFTPEKGSDCIDVEEGYISLVPLKIDTTDYELMEKLRPWEAIKI